MGDGFGQELTLSKIGQRFLAFRCIKLTHIETGGFTVRFKDALAQVMHFVVVVGFGYGQTGLLCQPAYSLHVVKMLYFADKLNHIAGFITAETVVQTHLR